VRVFLSHATADAPIARYLKTCFARVLGVDIFMMPDEADPGSEWIQVVRSGIQTCDELFSLATSESVKRPWIAAEWACFWLQEKPCTPLLAGARLDQLWEPMRAYQAADLLVPTRSLPLLQRLAPATGAQPAEGVLPLAHEIAEEIPRIQARIEFASAGQAATRIATHIRAGSENVDPDDVAVMVRTERLPELLDIVESPEATPVKMRQVAMALVGLARFGEALRVTLQIPNRAEARTVATTVVRSMSRGLGEDSDEWSFLLGVHDYLRPPQRRDVRDTMLRHGIAPLGPWTEPPVFDDE